MTYVDLQQLKILPILALLHSLEVIFLFFNKNSNLEENYLTCVINELLNKHMTKQWHGMETTVGNGRVISKDDYLWLIDSACKSGWWLCCDSRGREGRGRERSR